MSDETTEITEETTETTPETTETAPPALTDEQIAAALGVEPDYLAEVKGQIKDLGGFYAKVNNQNRELVEQKRALEAQAPATAAAPPSGDDDEELDPRSQAILDKFVAKKLAEALEPVYSTTRAQVEQAMSAVVDDFSATHSDVTPTKVDAIMEEEGLWELSTTPAKLKRNLERAYKLAKADDLDPQAEVERLVAERLKAAKDDGGEVVEVKPKRTSVTEPRSEGDILADKDIPWHKKLAMLNQS